MNHFFNPLLLNIKLVTHCFSYWMKQAWEHFQRGRTEELFDPNLMLHNYHTINVKNEVLRVLHVGLLCTQEIATLRPYMSKALQMLVKKEEELPPPTNPPFIDEKTMELHDPWEKYSNDPLREGDSASDATLSYSGFYPRWSPETDIKIPSQASYYIVSLIILFLARDVCTNQGDHITLIEFLFTWPEREIRNTSFQTYSDIYGI